MQFIRGLRNITSEHQDCVITIGNFDGVHRGHQALLAKVKAKARELNVPALVITFEPQPQEFFVPQNSIARLTRWREKFCELEKNHMDYLLTLSFDKRFAKLTATEFVETILCERLNVRHVILGDDFRFGFKREGDFEFLQKYTSQFTTEKMPAFFIENERVSSTRVRMALQNANHELVETLLGRPYSMLGKVIHGDKRGRLLGFPTANIPVHRKVAPIQGIYVVTMQIEDGPLLPGVASIGTRPAIPGDHHHLLEVHLFDFDKEIYGEHVKVEFHQKLRDEKYFENFELLTMQMQQDAAQARAYFGLETL